MKKYGFYIIPLIIALAVGFLVFTGDDQKERRFNERVTLRKRDKIPFGTYIAYQALTHFFPKATITSSKKEPGYWDSLSTSSDRQALMVVSPRFFADEYEMKTLIRFAENGNDVFVSTMVLGEDVKTMLNCSVGFFDLSTIFSGELALSDSLSVSLSNPPFTKSVDYTYPGPGFENHFFKIDSTTTTVLGNGAKGEINFIHLKAGKGNLYFHLSPMAFTNYFLLHRNNIHYYENLLSLISPSVKTIVWDEYYLNKRFYYEQNEKNDKSGWFNALLGYPGLKWALLTAIFTLLLFAFFEMGRKQRYIPVIGKPRNDSLDFVKTIGRLYFEKGDHRNLARKMASYFLEHVRNKYKLPTGNLDQEFVQKLQFKSGYPEEALHQIITTIRNLDNGETVNSRKLTEFYKQLETFYQHA